MYAEMIITILGLVTAILLLVKAYIEVRKAIMSNRKRKKGAQMDNTATNPPNHTEKSSSNEIRLKEHYTSLFAEDNKLKTELITITKQKNGLIEGFVILSETSDDKAAAHKYSLKGTYKNKILTAEYYSQNGNVDERGAINLKLIDTDILSGFCSFSKVVADDDIQASPYVWVAGHDKNLLDGTFDFCFQCFTNHQGCCCANPDIDMPVFLNNELNAIRNQIVNRPANKNMFSKPLDPPFDESPVRQMKKEYIKDQNGNIISSRCHFFDTATQKCQIYNGRPIDCRLFPFDIQLSQKTHEYVIGYYTELCACKIPDLTEMKKKAHILRPYFYLLYPYLHIFTSNQVCAKLKNADFKEIANYKDFIF